MRRDMMMFAIALYQRGQAGVGTRPVDEIRITPGIEMAVYERG